MSLRLLLDGIGLSDPWSGIGTYTRQVARALADDRPEWRVSLIDAPSASEHGGLAARMRRGIDRHLIQPVVLRRSGADLFLGCAGHLPLSRVGMPSIITVHDLAIYRRPDWFPSHQWFSVRIVVPLSFRRANAILAVSTHTASEVMDVLGVPRHRVHVVQLAASDRYRPLSEVDVARTRRHLDLPDRFVLFMSTIEPRKNLETLLEAWSRIPNRPPLVVAGRWGWRTERIREQLMAAGPGVRLLGVVDPEDMPGLYNAATCLAHPAWYEGFGLTPLEAMACGTPVVVSSTTSLPEVVEEGAVLVDPSDVEGWTNALERVLWDDVLRSQLRERGLLRAAELTWQRTARMTWSVVDHVLEEGRSGA